MGAPADHADWRRRVEGECPVDGCTRSCDTARYVMCGRCWHQVPDELGFRVYRTWGARVRAHHAEPEVEAHEAAKRAAIEHVEAIRRGAERQTRLEL